MGFLCVSLGSSTVRLQDSLGSRRACACSEVGFNSQNGDRAWGLYHRRAEFCFVILCAKGLNAKDIHKDIFPVYGGSFCHVKRLTTGSSNSLKDFRKSQTMPDKVPKWLTQQSRDFYAAGFDALVKRWVKCINVGGGYVEQLMLFLGSNVTCFTFYNHLWSIDWLSLVLLLPLTPLLLVLLPLIPAPTTTTTTTTTTTISAAAATTTATKTTTTISRSGSSSANSSIVAVHLLKCMKTDKAQLNSSRGKGSVY
jgi:hypothetical protein